MRNENVADTPHSFKWEVGSEIFFDIIHTDPIIITTASLACISVCSGTLPVSNGSNILFSSLISFVHSINLTMHVFSSRVCFLLRRSFSWATFALWQIYWTGHWEWSMQSAHCIHFKWNSIEYTEQLITSHTMAANMNTFNRILYLSL